MIACIGTRELHEQDAISVRIFAERIDSIGKDTVINTGAAVGVDQFSALKHLKNGGVVQLFLPWKDYERDFVNTVRLDYPENVRVKVLNEEDKEAMLSVRKYHPNFSSLTRGAKLLHARNYLIVYEVEKVIAFPHWKAGKPGGGTMQGVRIAESLGIPVEIYGNGALF